MSEKGSLDPTGRGLYRIREYEVDRHELVALKNDKHANGKPVWRADAIDQVMTGFQEEQRYDKMQSAGHSVEQNTSYRKPVPMHEFLCTILNLDGELVGRNQLIVMANKKSAASRPKARIAGRCPGCNAPSLKEFRPFCSQRCQDVDLGRWMRGSFRIPTEQAPNQAAPGEDADDDPPYGSY